MKVYYDGNYKIINTSGKEKIYNELKDIPDYQTKITEVEVKSGITKIKDYAFSECKLLKEINFPETLTEIGSYAFDACKSLEKIKLPDNINKIDHNAFFNCVSLKEINIPKNVTKINRSTFAYCESLSEIIIPKNIKEIEFLAFSCCSELHNIIFENSMPTINFTSFIECDNLDPKIKEKIFYQSAKNVSKFELTKFFEAYNINYSSELIQELITININFCYYAKDIDMEVFLDAVLDSINNIHKEINTIVITTDLCNIKLERDYTFLYLDDKINQRYITNSLLTNKIKDAIKEYQKKEGIER